MSYHFSWSGCDDSDLSKRWVLLQSTLKEYVYPSCHIGILVLTLTSQQLFSSLKQAITIREAFSKLHVLSSPSPLSLFDLLHMINDVFKTKVFFFCPFLVGPYYYFLHIWPLFVHFDFWMFFLFTFIISFYCSLFGLVLHFYKNKVWQRFIILPVLYMFLTLKSLSLGR
jgi:hypothetical protein